LNFFAELNNKNISSSRPTEEFMNSFIRKLEKDVRLAQNFLEEYGISKDKYSAIAPLSLLRGDVFKAVLASLNCLFRDSIELSEQFGGCFLKLSRIFSSDDENVDDELQNTIKCV
jgi:hypothetical protein